MLRNSASPASSHKLSPPVTRSASRLAQLANRSGAHLDCSTPTSRMPPDRNNYIRTVERLHEVADDDEDQQEDNPANDSRFIYKQHFSMKERLEMYFDGFSVSPICRWKAVQRRFFPTLSSLKNGFILILLASMVAKYLQDNYNQYNAEGDLRKLKASIEERITSNQQKIFELFDRQRGILIDLEEFHKRYGHNETIIEDFHRRVIKLEEKVANLNAEIGILRDQQKEAMENQQTVYSMQKEEVVVKQSPPTKPVSKKTNYGINVANSLIGATIDEKCSSRTVSAKNSMLYDMVSYVMSFKEGYVLLERDSLNPGEAWCTYDNRPTLTINLARWIKPTGISYQHVKWSGILPDNAPKTFDVVACRSKCCLESEPLVTGCRYGQTAENGEDVQEQMCQVVEKVMKPVNHVQFRFKENYGNVTKTCAYLVRVFGEVVSPPPPQMELEAQTNGGKGGEGEQESAVFGYFSS